MVISFSKTNKVEKNLWTFLAYKIKTVIFAKIDNNS